MPALSYRLRSAREKAGLLQAQLAAGVGVNPSTVSHWESGRRKPSLPLLTRIAELTFTNTDDLLQIEPKPKVRRKRSPVVVVPTSKRDLSRDERVLLAFWRGLSERQRQN